MTPAEFAAILDRAYVDMCPWTESELTQTLTRPSTVFLHRETAGVIAQITEDECEILALAVDPTAQRAGIASDLLSALDACAADQGNQRTLLEVASRNSAARAFYAAQGFAQVGLRKRYYTLRDGSKDDALLLSRPVPWGQSAPSPNTA